MREYILTEKERKVLKNYIESQLKDNHFYVLIHRLRKCYEGLRKDMDMIDQVLNQKQSEAK